MDTAQHRSLRFGRNFRLDQGRGQLFRDVAELRLRPKTTAVLEYLLAHPQRLISKDELLRAIWGRRIVTEGALTQCLIELRRALGDEDRELLRTFPRRGYMLDTEVVVETGAAVAAVDAGPSPIEAPTGLSCIPSRRAPPLAVAASALALTVLPAGSLGPPTAVAIGANLPMVEDLEADPMRHVLLGRHYHRRRYAGDLERAVTEFQAALALQPALGAAWVGLAGSYAVLDYAAISATNPPSVRWREAVEAALRFAPDDPEAHIRARQFHQFAGDPELMAWHEQQVATLDPENALFLAIQAGARANAGRYDEALMLARRVVDAEPVAWLHRRNLIVLLMRAGRLDEAAAELDEVAMETLVEPAELHSLGAEIRLAQGRDDEARALADLLPAGRTELVWIREILDDRSSQSDAWIAGVVDLDLLPAAAVLSSRGEVEPALRLVSELGRRVGKDSPLWAKCRLDLEHSGMFESLRRDPQWLAAVEGAGHG